MSLPNRPNSLQDQESLSAPQGPEKFLAALAVLRAVWQSQSHFNPKLGFFGSSKAAPENRGTLLDEVSEAPCLEDLNM